MAESNAITKLTRYGRFMVWLMRDAFGRRPWLTTMTVLCGWLAVLAEVAALGLALYYAHLFAEDRAVTLADTTFVARESKTLLLAFGIASAAIMVAAAGLQYAGRLGRLRLRRQYGDACSNRVLSRLSDHPLDERAAMTLARSDSLLCGRAAYILISALTGGLAAAAALAAMLVIEPILTALLLAFGLVGAIFMYHISVRGARSSRTVEELAGSSKEELRGTLRRIADPAAGEGEAFPDEVGPIGQRHLDAYIMRIRAIADSEFAANILFALLLALILVSLGLMAMHEDSTWERVIAYLIGLRYLLVNGRTFVRGLTSMNRFYPQVSRYWDYLRGSKPVIATAAAPLDDDDD